MNNLEEKYIDLLLNRCINFNKSKKLIKKAKEMGVTDISIDEDDIYLLHDKLASMTLEEIETDENSSFLGEAALVNYDSPISNTKLVFGTTLFDENASCHLALGRGFNQAIPNGFNMSKEELLKNGINQSKTHIDFMIGTEDLNIEAETEKGKILIFKNGNFNILK